MTRWFGWALFCLGLSSCIHTPPPGRAAGHGGDGWALEGKIAVRADDFAGSYRIQWLQNPRDFRISLYGPLGQTAAVLRGDDEGAYLQVAGEEPRAGPNAQVLLEDALAWSAPLEEFVFWLQGRPIPEMAYQEERDDTGRLSKLRQLGWDITYDRYGRLEGGELPTRIRFEQGVRRLTLIIRKCRGCQGF